MKQGSRKNLPRLVQRGAGRQSDSLSMAASAAVWLRMWEERIGSGLWQVLFCLKKQMLAAHTRREGTGSRCFAGYSPHSTSTKPLSPGRRGTAGPLCCSICWSLTGAPPGGKTQATALSPPGRERACLCRSPPNRPYKKRHLLDLSWAALTETPSNNGFNIMERDCLLLPSLGSHSAEPVGSSIEWRDPVPSVLRLHPHSGVALVPRSYQVHVPHCALPSFSAVPSVV